MESTTEVLEKLHQVEETLIKRSHHLDAKIHKEKVSAKQLKETNRKEALRCLKRSKGYERMLSQSTKYLDRVQSLSCALDKATTSAQVITALQSAKQSFQEAATHHKQVQHREHDCVGDVDAGDEVVTEEMRLLREVLDTFSASNDDGPSLHSSPLDDEELMKELKCLEEEQLPASDADVSIKADVKRPEPSSISEDAAPSSEAGTSSEGKSQTRQEKAEKSQSTASACAAPQS